MAKLIAGSQLSMLHPQLHAHASSIGRGCSITGYAGVTAASYKPIMSLIFKSGHSSGQLTSAISPHKISWLLKKHDCLPVLRASDFDVEPVEPDDVEPFITYGGAGDDGSDGAKGGGDGGGGDSGGGNKDNEGSSDEPDGKKNKALSMSQKITLAYAALVGLGGFIGFLKSRSQKSLAAGGLSALLLYYVSTELPKRPIFASSVGLGLSAALLVVMGSRFKRSGKVFPAGIVSLASLIMTGGYVHGIMKVH